MIQPLGSLRTVSLITLCEYVTLSPSSVEVQKPMVILVRYMLSNPHASSLR